MRKTSIFVWSIGLAASAIAPILAVLIVAVAYPMYAAGWNYAADWTTYFLGMAMWILLLAFTFVGVPVVASRNGVGFWRGLLGVLAVLAWMVLSLAPFLGVIAFGSYASEPLVVLIVHAIAAMSCGVMLWRNGRKRRHGAADLVEVFA